MNEYNQYQKPQHCESCEYMKDTHRQLIELEGRFQRQSEELAQEKHQRAVLAEKVAQQQTLLSEGCKQQAFDRYNSLQQHIKLQRQQQDINILVNRISEEIKQLQGENDDPRCSTNSCAHQDLPFSRVLSMIPSWLPAPTTYPHVDWSPDYSKARLEDMLEVPKSSRNELWYELMDFHVKRIKQSDPSFFCCDDLMKRVKNQLKTE